MHKYYAPAVAMDLGHRKSYRRLTQASLKAYIVSLVLSNWINGGNYGGGIGR
jgi:hypothetical protein